MNKVHSAVAGKSDFPQGTAYGRAPAFHDPSLTEVGPGTPCGEYLRRFWHPVALSAEVSARPRLITPLGEELIIFRDGSGRPGLLYPRCMHRGTSLFYGRVNEQGIRCCYHGWLFDVEGNCLEQPCEPKGGRPGSSVRQPWYPVQERYGLVFAYMGPPEKMPILPKIQQLENLGPEEHLHAMYDTGADKSSRQREGQPCNWLQSWENMADPLHVQVLHAPNSGVSAHTTFMIKPDIKFDPAPNGVVFHILRKLDNGSTIDRINQIMLPNMSSFPSPDLTPGKARGAQWWVAFGDTSNVLFNVQVTNSPVLERRHVPLTPDGRPWADLTEEEHQDYPDDFEAQVGQGPITLHSEEHLARSDVGVVMLRRLLEQQIRLVQEGGDPIGVSFTDEDAKLDLLSGTFFYPAPEAGN